MASATHVQLETMSLSPDRCASLDYTHTPHVNKTEHLRRSPVPLSKGKKRDSIDATSRSLASDRTLQHFLHCIASYACTLLSSDTFRSAYARRRIVSTGPSLRMRSNMLSFGVKNSDVTCRPPLPDMQRQQSPMTPRAFVSFILGRAGGGSANQT